MGNSQHKDKISMEFKFKPFKLESHSNKCSRFIDACNNKNPELLISPKARSGHRIVCDDINFYSFGGYNPALSPSDETDLENDGVWLESKPLFRELWKCNMTTGLWTKLNVERIPDILASNAVYLSGHILMVYGGTGVPFGANCSKDLYICDLGNNNNNKLEFNLISSTGQCPQPQYGQAIVLKNHYLYTVGGTTGFEYSCDIHRLNLRDGTWEPVYISKGTDNEPLGRYRHEVAVDNDKIYLLGGGTAHEAFGFKVIFVFSMVRNSWEKLFSRPDNNAREAYPIPRRCHSCVQHGQYAYIMGGFSGRLILRDIWRLDLHCLQWEKFNAFTLERGVYFHSSCLTSSGKMFMFGGIVQSDNGSKRSAEVHSAWLCIPKLKEISWEAFVFYFPTLALATENELIAQGLPLAFIHRLDLCKTPKSS